MINVHWLSLFKHEATSPDFAAESVATNQSSLRRTVDGSSGRLALRDQLATLFTDNPETFSFTVNALVRLSTSTIPWIDIVFVSIDP